MFVFCFNSCWLSWVLGVTSSGRFFFSKERKKLSTLFSFHFVFFVEEKLRVECLRVFRFNDEVMGFAEGVGRWSWWQGQGHGLAEETWVVGVCRGVRWLVRVCKLVEGSIRVLG